MTKRTTAKGSGSASCNKWEYGCMIYGFRGRGGLKANVTVNSKQRCANRKNESRECVAVSLCMMKTVTHLPLSVTEKTSRKPSPVLMYCSLMAPNSSCPAVSRTREFVHTHWHHSHQHDNWKQLVPRVQQQMPWNQTSRGASRCFFSGVAKEEHQFKGPVCKN